MPKLTPFTKAEHLALVTEPCGVDLPVLLTSRHAYCAGFTEVVSVIRMCFAWTVVFGYHGVAFLKSTPADRRADEPYRSRVEMQKRSVGQQHVLTRIWRSLVLGLRTGLTSQNLPAVGTGENGLTANTLGAMVTWHAARQMDDNAHTTDRSSSEL